MMGKKKRADRRFLLLKRMGLFSNNTQGAQIIRATTVEDLIAAYRLVHDVFVRQGFISPDVTGITIRIFEALPETATFIAKIDDVVVGLTSVVMDSIDLGLPTDTAFKAEIDTIRGDQKKVCEGTNWLMANSHHSAVMTELMRCSFAHATVAGCTDLVGSVNPGHARFYQLLGFEQLGEVCSYSKEIEDPVAVVRLDMSGLIDRFRNVSKDGDDIEAFFLRYYIEDNPYHQYIKGWQNLSDILFADVSMLRTLFVIESQFLSRCSQDQKKAVERRWGKEIFQAVF